MSSSCRICSARRSFAKIRSAQRQGRRRRGFRAVAQPDVRVVPVARRLDADNAEDLLAGHDLVLDGSDNFATRLVVNDACVDAAHPLVSAAAGQFQGQIGLFRGWEADAALLPLLRRRCVRRGGLRQLRGARRARRADRARPAIFAALIALRALLGIGEDAAGKLHLLDGVALNWRVDESAQGPGVQDLRPKP